MASITIRNIPDSVLSKIRSLSKVEMRSINSELLLLIEQGLNQQLEQKQHDSVVLSKERQLEIWENLAGTWEDSRSAEEIIEDIYSQRTKGRQVVDL